MAEHGRINVNAHPAVVAIVDWFIPGYQHQQTMKHLLGESRSSLSLLVQTAKWLVIHVGGQIWPAFSSRLFLAETAALAAAFAGAPLGAALYIAISAVLLGLILRDAWAYPRVGTPFDLGIDTSAALLFLLGVETVVSYFMPGHALPAVPLFRGFALSLLTVSTVRVIFRRPPGTEIFGDASFHMTVSITGLWITAVMALRFLEPPFPGLFRTLDLLLGPVFITLFVTAFRLQWNPFEPGFKPEIQKLEEDHPIRVLIRKHAWLWKEPEWSASSVPWHLVLEVLAFIAFCAPTALMVVAWATGYLPPSKMDWFLVATNTFKFFSLTVLWIAIRKANRRLAAALMKEIEKIKVAEAARRPMPDPAG